jgi:Flp pilus assembly protein TadD
VVYTHQGRHAETVALLKSALQQRLDYAQARNLLQPIVAQQAAGADLHRQVSADRLNDEGAACLEQGKLEDDARRFREAIRIRPDFPEAYNNLGFSLADL